MFPPPPPTPRPQRPSHPRPHPRPHLPPILPPSLLVPPQPHPSYNNNDNRHLLHHSLIPPSPKHASAVTNPPFLTAMHPHPPPMHSAQTQNILSVAEPTQSNYPWSLFPVNVIPYVNGTAKQPHHQSREGSSHSSHMINPLIHTPYSPNRAAIQPGSPSIHQTGTGENSRAASVLGNSGSGFGGRSIDPAMSAASSGEPNQSRYLISPNHAPTNFVTKIFFFAPPTILRVRNLLIFNMA